MTKRSTIGWMAAHDYPRPSDQPVSSKAPLARKPFCWHQREALDAAIARSEEAIRHSRESF